MESPNPSSRRRAALLVGATILIVPPVLLAPAWRLWGLSALEDGLLYYLPQRAWFGATVASGELPLWQHETYGGFPAYADPQTAIFYPPTWLFVILPARWAYPLSICLHHWIAAWLMYRLCRSMGRGRAASLLGGIAFTLCGFLLSHREHLTMHHAAAWLPGVLWAWHRFASTAKWKHACLGTVMVAAQLFAGHAQVTLMTAPVAIAWVAWQSWRRPRIWLTCMGGLGSAAAIGLVQIVPAMRLLAESAERGEAYFVLYNSLLWRALVLPIFPMLLGQRTPNLYDTPWYAPSHQCEQTIYVTVLMLGLAMGGLLLRWRSDPHVRFWAIAGLVGLVLALGKNAGVYALLIDIPVFRMLHTPARWVLIVHVALILVGVRGADAVIHLEDRAVDERRTWRRIVPTLLGSWAIVVLLWFLLSDAAQAGRAAGFANPALWIPLGLLAGCVVLLRWGARPHAPMRRAAVLSVLLVIDLATIAPFLDVSRKPTKAITHSPVADALRRHGFRPRQDRVWVIPGDPYEDPRECMMPDTNLLDGMDVLNGYGPLLPKELKALFGFRPFSVTERTEQTLAWLARPAMLGRLGISHLVVRDPNVPTIPAGQGWRLLETVEGPTQIYRNAFAAKRWYLTEEYRLQPDASKCSELVREAENGLERPVELVGEVEPPRLIGPGRILSADVRRNRARFEIDSDQGCLLVWMNRHHPDWRASISAKEAPIYVADVLGQAVFVPSGRQEVLFEVRPFDLQVYGLTSIALLAALLALWGFALARER